MRRKSGQQTKKMRKRKRGKAESGKVSVYVCVKMGQVTKTNENLLYDDSSKTANLLYV